MKRVLIGASAIVAVITIAPAEEPTITCRRVPMLDPFDPEKKPSGYLVLCSTRQPLAELKPVPKRVRGIDLIKENYARRGCRRGFHAATGTRFAVLEKPRGLVASAG
jgi:hypothetical protein